MTSSSEVEVVLGIDPGHVGGICVLCVSSNKILATYRMPLKSAQVKSRPNAKTVDEDEIESIISKYSHAKLCVIEKQRSRPGEGHVGAFSLGFGYGKIIGILAGKIPTLPLESKQWRAISLHPHHQTLYEAYGDDVVDLDGKDLSIETAKALHPYFCMPTLKPRGKKLHDGIAEAILMADTARQKYLESYS